MDYLVEIVSTKPIYVGPCVDSLVALFARSMLERKNAVLYCG